jgi:transcriptional regulator with XRE-family HTH domain
MMPIMSLAKRISERMAALGLSQEQLAEKVGVTQQAICSIVNGETKNPRGKTLVGISSALETPTDWLLNGTSNLGFTPSSPPDGVHGLLGPPQPFEPTPVAQPSEMKQTIPVYGSAQGGNGDGWFELNGHAIDHVRRPSGLENVRGAYALRVQGISMEPRYFEGELVYVNPARSVAPGCFVVIQMKPQHDGDPIKAFIKQLVRRTSEKLVVHQYQPEMDYEIPMSDVLHVHRILNGEELT